MNRQNKLLILILGLALLIILAKIVDSYLPINDKAGSVQILFNNFWLIITTLASAVLGSIVIDIYQKGGIKNAAITWIPSRLPSERAANRKTTLLAGNCLELSQKCLEELNDYDVNQMTGEVVFLGSNLIRELNWIYRKKISLIRLRQSKEPNIDPVDIRLPVVADYQGPLSIILNNQSNQHPRGTIVLGLPGFGKTFSIHQAIVEANTGAVVDKPMVFFSLTYWLKDRSLKQWMQDELEKNYRINPDDALEIINSNSIQPIFDGLDQVNSELRVECAKKISEYSSINPVIITSRPLEFEAIVTYFRTKEEWDYEQSFALVELLPLGHIQVESIIKEKMRFDNREDVLEWIRSNQEFGSLIRSPMILYIVWKIQDKLTKEALKELKGKGSKENIAQLWSLYDAHIFEKESVGNKDILRKKLQKSITFPEQASRMWLHHLAQKFSENKKSFFIENLQPDFLTRPVDVKAYIFLSRIITSTILAMAAGYFLSGPTYFVEAGLLSGILTGWITLFLHARRSKLSSNPRPAAPKFTQLRLVFTILYFSFPVLFILALFLGLATPRQAADMHLGHTFAFTEANVAVLLTLFIGISHGVRESQYLRGDIRPVEQIKLNSINAAWFGIKGGFLLGLFLLVCVKVIQAVGSTFDEWVRFNPYGFDIGLFALLIGLILGSPLISLLKMLDENNISIDEKDKKRYNTKPNYGISQSIRNLAKASLVIGLVMTGLLGLFSGVLTNEPSCLIKGLRAGLGASLLASLWFGGFDVINHFILRFIIEFNQYGPRSFNQFFEFSSRLRLTRTTGASFEFAHDTISDYYRYSGSLKLRHYRQTQIGLFALVTGLIAISLFFMIKRRYLTEFYWSTPNGFMVNHLPRSVRQLSDSTVVVTKSSTLTAAVRGEVYLGTFIGDVGPSGTEAGFIGFRLGDSYDVKSMRKLPHGAFYIKRLNRHRPQVWQFQPKSILDFNSLFPNYFTTTQSLQVMQYDTLQFGINDREWQNNFGKFEVTLAVKK